jgi:hypothetical protein
MRKYLTSRFFQSLGIGQLYTHLEVVDENFERKARLVKSFNNSLGYIRCYEQVSGRCNEEATRTKKKLGISPKFHSRQVFKFQNPSGSL